jgi:hypothetical protein
MVSSAGLIGYGRLAKAAMIVRIGIDLGGTKIEAIRARWLACSVP